MPDAARMVRTGTPTPGVPTQFDIAAHYRDMLELDSDVHNDRPLAQAEIALALGLLGDVPKSVFLPCCGMGRHIPPLRGTGIGRIHGVDLSAPTIELARTRYGGERGVTFEVGDLCAWSTPQPFKAAFLLGNSWADTIDHSQLLEMTRRIAAAIEPGGSFVMDYIGEGYLDRCIESRTSRWYVPEFRSAPALDDRTPRFDPASGVMTIEIAIRRAEGMAPFWHGSYQKLVLPDAVVISLFAEAGIRIERVGVATTISPYHAAHAETLGMLGASTWWRGTKRG